jgi:23S rRNA (uridine2552-2'-O)-methyltransferase
MSSKIPPKNPNGKVTKLKSKSGRTLSQRSWLLRQLNDPYVKSAKVQGYRSRAAYKLKELNDKYHFLKKSMSIIDLGAAPGGWSQIAADLVGEKGKVLAIDLNPMDELPNVIFVQGDFLDARMQDILQEKMGSDKVDVILSDMAAVTTGHANTDHLRIIVLVETAFAFSLNHLKIGGTFVAKVFQGGTEGSLLGELKLRFQKVFHAKPNASRADSKEIYVIAMGFKG